jgi:hypothetical protein
MAATMVGVVLLFSHVKNAQCTDSYMKKGGQIKMSILTFFLARSLRMVRECQGTADAWVTEYQQMWETTEGLQKEFYYTP